MNQALTNRVRAYKTYSESYILQTSIRDYLLISTLTNTLFQFPEYVMKQISEIRYT